MEIDFCKTLKSQLNAYGLVENLQVVKNQSINLLKFKLGGQYVDLALACVNAKVLDSEFSLDDEQLLMDIDKNSFRSLNALKNS